jgi:hypothetical protein
MKSEETKSRPTWRTTTTMLLPSTVKGPGQRWVSPTHKTIEIIRTIEETNNHQDSTGEEAQTVETMSTETTNSATSANSWDTDKKNARKESRKTNPAMTPRAEHTGAESN